MSAKTDKRDGLQTALGMLYCGDADLLVVTHLDRFARNARDCLNMIEEGKAQGWKVCSPTWTDELRLGQFNGQADDYTQMHDRSCHPPPVLAAVAENFSNLTSRR